MLALSALTFSGCTVGLDTGYRNRDVAVGVDTTPVEVGVYSADYPYGYNYNRYHQTDYRNVDRYGRSHGRSQAQSKGSNKNAYVHEKEQPQKHVERQ